jgi:preprotein translocase subunit SecG
LEFLQQCYASARILPDILFFNILLTINAFENRKFVSNKNNYTMKKFLAFFASLMIVAVLAFTVMAFTDDDPKKQKTETTASASDTTKTCSKHADTQASTDGKKCCKEEGKTASADCKKSEACKHSKNTADAATTDKE